MVWVIIPWTCSDIYHLVLTCSVMHKTCRLFLELGAGSSLKIKLCYHIKLVGVNSFNFDLSFCVNFMFSTFVTVEWFHVKDFNEKRTK